MWLIKILQPQSVSEVGCKLGINQIILGAQFLQITCNNFSRSGNSIDTVQALSGTNRLSESLLDYSLAFSHDFETHRRVQVKQGNAVFLTY